MSLPTVDEPGSTAGNAKTTRLIDQNSTQVNDPPFNLKSQITTSYPMIAIRPRMKQMGECPAFLLTYFRV